MTYTLILLRHGESDWNAKNLFTGWVDVDLTEKGRAEAVRGGELLVEAGLLPDVVHTSLLRRAITTAHLALDAADRHWIPVRRSWRLNERHYGALQGKDKKQTLEEYGEEQFMLWRRSFDTPPPPLDDDDEFSQVGDPRYADLGDEMPRTECLKDVIDPVPAVLESDIVPDLQDGQTVLVAAHGNSLRALVKHLDGISDEDIAGLNIPTGMPLVYRLDDEFRPTVRGRRVPRPRGRRRGRRRRRQPGPLTPRRPGTRRHATSSRVTRSVGGGLAGDQVDDAVGDGDGVVGDPLVVAAEQGDVDGRLDAVRSSSSPSSSRNDLRRSWSISSSTSCELLGALDVALGDDVGDLADHQLGDHRHPARSSARRPRVRRPRAPAAGPPWRRAPPGRPSARGRRPSAARRRGSAGHRPPAAAGRAG